MVCKQKDVDHFQNFSSANNKLYDTQVILKLYTHKIFKQDGIAAIISFKSLQNKEVLIFIFSRKHVARLTYIQ